MQMESLVGGVTGGYEAVPVVKETGSTSAYASEMEITPINNQAQKGAEKGSDNSEEKEPAKSSMEAAISLLNSQIAKTHCAYSYDEATKRVSIKVFDDETDELIREVPPEKSLEALKKMWEIAGIIIDEKR